MQQVAPVQFAVFFKAVINYNKCDRLQLQWNIVHATMFQAGTVCVGLIDSRKLHRPWWVCRWLNVS